jgi:hypothetical protein
LRVVLEDAMKKSWMFLLLTPFITLSATYPIYDEEYDTDYDIELNAQDAEVAAESQSEELNQEIAQEELNEADSFAYDNEVQEDEVFIAPQPRSTEQNTRSYSQRRSQDTSKSQAAAPSIQKKRFTPNTRRSPLKNDRSNSQANTAARSKMKDARQNSNRPRVTHRGQEQQNSHSAQQIEADAQTEEQSYNGQSEQPQQKRQSAKAKKAPAAAEKKTGQVTRSYWNKKAELKGKNYRQNAKKTERKSNSFHSGQRPIVE